MAQQVEQLTRNEQVVRSNRISSSSLKAENIAENRYVLGFFLFAISKTPVKIEYSGKCAGHFASQPRPHRARRSLPGLAAA